MSYIYNLVDSWTVGTTVYNAVKMNVSDVASDPASLLMDLQIGGVSQEKTSKGGNKTLVGSLLLNSNSIQIGGPGNVGLNLSNDAFTIKLGGGQDVVLARDAANTLAQRNGVNAQAFNIYNSYTDAANYEVGGATWKGLGNYFVVGTAFAGTGTTRNLFLSSSGGIYFGAGNGTFASVTAHWVIPNTGNFIANTDNSFDIGIVGNSPRYIRAASAIQTKALTVATLPAAATALAGARSFVTDATVATFGSTAVGGGANAVPVVSDGTTWKIG